MRKPGWRTTARFHAVRALRRLEILISPLLGAVSFVVGQALGWLLLITIGLLWVVMLPLVLVVLGMGTRARRNLLTEKDVEKIIRTGYIVRPKVLK